MDKQEKRKAPRFNVVLSFEYQNLSPANLRNKRHKTTTMVNVSEGGLGFTAKFGLGVGSTCAFWIKMPPYPEPALAIGKVIWQNKSSGTFIMGIRWIYWDNEQAKDWLVECSQSFACGAASVALKRLKTDKKTLDMELDDVPSQHPTPTGLKGPEETPVSGGRIPGQIEQLAKRNERGILSETEFEEKKQELLSRFHWRARKSAQNLGQLGLNSAKRCPTARD